MAVLSLLPLSTIPLAANTGPVTFLYQVGYQAAGMMIVLGALGGLWLMVSALGRALRLTRAGQPPVALSAAASSRPIAAPLETGLDPRLIAAISAAIHVTLKSRFQLVSIQPEHTHTPAWSQEGRREIYQSHRVR
jgi:hypothetical protein